MTTPITPQAQELNCAFVVRSYSSARLRDVIARERIYKRAFGPLAEACRKELARRSEQA